MPAEVFQYRAFTRLKQLEHLIRTRQIDSEFFLERGLDYSTESLIRKMPAFTLRLNLN